MARFARIDVQIRANHLILANRFRTETGLKPFFCESHFRGLKLANRRFEAIRANRLHVMKIVFFCFLRIHSREWICANRPDSRCESPGPLTSLSDWNIWRS